MHASANDMGVSLYFWSGLRNEPIVSTILLSVIAHGATVYPLVLSMGRKRP